MGIDLVPDFIESAQQTAKQLGLASRLAFRQGDMAQAIEKPAAFDLVIFGLDSQALGSLPEALSTLTLQLRPKGYLLLDLAWVRGETRLDDLVLTEGEILATIAKHSFEICHQQEYSPAWINRQNQLNTQAIAIQTERLTIAYPQKAALFRGYLQTQLEACRSLSDDMLCGFFLLQKK